VSLAETQQQLIDDYLLIENSQERFSALVDRARAHPGVPESEHCDANLVPGCVSRVWLVGEVENGVCRFRADAESSILRGIVSLLANLYSGHPPEEVLATEPEFLERLHLLDHLSPTRRKGLRHVRTRMKEIAEG